MPFSKIVSALKNKWFNARVRLWCFKNRVNFRTVGSRFHYFSEQIKGAVSTDQIHRTGLSGINSELPSLLKESLSNQAAYRVFEISSREELLSNMEIVFNPKLALFYFKQLENRKK